MDNFKPNNIQIALSLKKYERNKIVNFKNKKVVYIFLSKFIFYIYIYGCMDVCICISNATFLIEKY